MGHSKLANGNGCEARIGGSASSAQQDQMARRPAGKKVVRKKTAARKANSAPPLRKKMIASRNQADLSVAIAAAKTLLQVSSSGAIVDAGSVSVNAMARPHGAEKGPDSQGFGLFFFSAKFQCRALAVTDFSAVQSDSVVPAPPSLAPPCAPFSRLLDKINPSFLRRNLSRSKSTVSNLSARRDPVCT
jgi:hypothetical protein